MEKIAGVQSRRGDILHSSITLGLRGGHQPRQIRSQEHQPVLVGAVVGACAVLVCPAVLMLGWQAVFMAVIASGPIGMRGSGGRGLMMHGTIT